MTIDGSKPCIARVAINTPVRKLFDYQIATPCEVGVRVTVSFGRRKLVGVVMEISADSDLPKEKLKYIDDVIDAFPLLDQRWLTLCQLTSDYYHHSIGEVVACGLPKKIRQGLCVEINENIDVVDSVVPDITLTKAQREAINAVLSVKKFQPFLLFGVTGSGKTEVYARVIEVLLQQEKQALILVPEISLTPQTVQRFQSRFSVPVLLLHSGLTETKRAERWMQATQKKPCIVIGTRSAIFAPLKNLGIIVVDEEHDLSFKQKTGFRYSARDIAVMRAKIENIPVILGSATPSLESWYNVQQKKYHLLTLLHRPGSASLPAVTLHDINNAELQNGLSAALIEKMQAHLSAGNQVLVFLNRRGFAPVLHCHQCGFSEMCPHCDARLTLHQQPRKLICHHCGYTAQVPRICPQCQQRELIEFGVGTEMLEETLKTLFPDKKITRIDRDVIKNFKTLEKVLEEVRLHQTDIIVGTQMLVKGHHFSDVTLVAVVDVDQALFSGDFRAIERLGQSLVQVAGRAGRAEKPGEVFIQTHYPAHLLLLKSLHAVYSEFSDQLLLMRKKSNLPPTVHLAMIRAESKKQVMAQNFLNQLKKKLQTEQSGISIAGPFASLMEKKAGVYRAQLVIQSHQRRNLKNLTMKFLSTMDSQKKPSGVRWFLEMDPVEV